METQSEVQKSFRFLALVSTPITLLLIVSLFLFMQMGSKTGNLIQNGSEVTGTSSNISASDNQRVSRATTTIVAFGDSITAGYSIKIPDAYPAVLERVIRDAGYDIAVVNAGVSGETTAGGLRRADFVAAQKPDIVIVALGGNDVLRGIDPASTRNNLAGIIETFQRGGAKVVLAGMYAPENLGETYVDQFNAIYPVLAREFNVPLVPFLLEGVALDPSKNQRDGIHPNEEGARIIAEVNLFPRLLPFLDN